MVTSFGGVGAVARAPIGVIRASAGTRALLVRCMQDVLDVSRTRKVALAATVVDDTLKFLDTIPGAATTSLHRDIADGKPSELDYWSGAVVRLGREAGVSTPGHMFVYDCLLPQELRARGKSDFQRL
jgi:2-dehydropantoate 2-reductase